MSVDEPATDRQHGVATVDGYTGRMKRSNGKALVVGASFGLILALSLMLYIAATGAVPSVNATVDNVGVVPVFAPAASALWISLILGASFGGLVLAIGTGAVSRVIEPEARPASFAVVAVVGAVVSPIIAMSVLPLGIIVLGSIEEGTATIGVVELVSLTAIIGIVAGGLVVWLSSVLSRPPEAKEDVDLLAETADRSA